MPESKPKSEPTKSTEQLFAERQSDATDDESLKAEEKGSGAASRSESDHSPSPDGQFDEKREGDEAGPM